jgi:hypothetical protein
MQSTPPPNLPEEQPPVTYIPLSQTEIVTESAPPEQRRNGCLWGMLGAGGCLLILLVILLIPVLLGISSVSGLLNSVVSIFNPRSSPPIATIYSTQTLVTGVQPLGQLVSVSSQLAKADIGIGIQQGTLNSCGFAANHVAQGAIEAGIDLTQITEDAITYNAATNTYTLHLPAPQLTSCRIDFIRQYDRSFTTCAVDWDEARLLANYKALVDFRDDALEGGILSRAQQEAKLVIGNFVKLLTNGNVEIIFDDSARNAFPPSCTPEIPAGWVVDERTQQWTKP